MHFNIALKSTNNNYIYIYTHTYTSTCSNLFYCLILFQLLAEELGIKELVPAYLDPYLQPQELKTGVCFASGGSGYDSLTPKIVVCTYNFVSFLLDLNSIRLFRILIHAPSIFFHFKLLKN